MAEELWDNFKFEGDLGQLQSYLQNTLTRRDSDRQEADDGPREMSTDRAPDDGDNVYQERLQFYYKPTHKRMSVEAPNQRQKQDGLQSAMLLSRDTNPVEPRVLSLIGSHAALSKLQKQSNFLLKKLLRQAGINCSLLVRQPPNPFRSIHFVTLALTS